MKNVLKTMLGITAALVLLCGGVLSCDSSVSSEVELVTPESQEQTVVNADGTTTVIVTNPDGSTEATTTKTDGSTVVVTTSSDGLSVTTEEKDAEGNTTKTTVATTTQNDDGSSSTSTEVTDSDGNTSTTTTETKADGTKETKDEEGNVISTFAPENVTVTAEDLGLTPATVSSTDEKVAKAARSDTGVTITSVGEGNATITVKDKDEHSATVAVTVSETGAFSAKKITKYVAQSQEPENPEPDDPQTEATGTVAITVDVDGKYHCPVHDEHAYDTKEEAGNCGVEEDCPGYKYTVTFTNTDPSATEKTKTVKVKKGTALATDDIPAWTHSDTTNTYDLEWTADAEHATYTITSLIRADVTFKTNWKQYYTVTFKDSVAGTGDDAIAAVAPVTKKVYADAEEKTVSAPDWAKTGYTLSWDPNFDEDNDVTASVEYTAVWTGKQKYTVTFVDTVATPVGEGGKTVAKKDNYSYDLFEGDKISELPEWADKTEFYTLSWTSAPAGVKPGDAITQNVTLTAVWTEHKKYKVQFVDTAAGTGTDAIAAKTDSEKDSQIIYEGETATLPSWVTDATKTASYRISWKDEANASISDPSAVEITKNTTFTATWTEIPKETVITFDNNASQALSGNPTGYATTSTAKDYGRDTHFTWTSDSGTKVDVRYGAKMNSKNSISLKLDASYTVLFVLGSATTNNLKITDSSNTEKTATLKNGIVTASLTAGTYTIVTAGSETSVAAIVLQK